MRSEHIIHHTQEREFSSGMLSVTSTFRLLITGDTELKHLDRLIRLLTIQKQMLEEDEIEDAMPNCAWYCPPGLQQTPGA